MLNDLDMLRFQLQRGIEAGDNGGGCRTAAVRVVGEFASVGVINHAVLGAPGFAADGEGAFSECAFVECGKGIALELQ